MENNWSRREFIQKTTMGVGGGAMALASFNKSFAGNSAKRPNILWIVSEDNDPFLGCYGDKNAITHNIDALSKEGITYDNAFSNAPVCAPARSTIITGMYAPNIGTMHMRSKYPIPSDFKFFPQYLRAAGYYCTNNAKEDYNTIKPKGVWDESSNKAHYKNRKPGQPFFAVFNINLSHEHVIHYSNLIEPDKLIHKPEDMELAPNHPDVPDIRYAYADYYDYITMMDKKVGELLKELEEFGLKEDTIVFYYADNGGVLPGSKRYLFEAGTRVPMIVRFPQKYQHLSVKKAGEREDRLVQFVDLAATVLSLAGIEKAPQMQGHPFLGKYISKEPEYAFCYRNRMDERYDMMRSVRDKKYLYIRNYYPHRIYGQHIWYLWRAPATRAWEKAYKEGKCDKAQSRFWETKPVEELYDIQKDPHNINNLSADPAYAATLKRMRGALHKWVRENRDSGFLPEGWLTENNKDKTVYAITHDPDFPMEIIIETAEKASEGNPAYLPVLKERLKNEHPVVRYWSAVGCTILGKEAQSAAATLKNLLQDEDGDVRIAASEALCAMDDCSEPLKVLLKEIRNNNSKIQLHALNVLDALGEKVRPVLKEFMGINPWGVKTDGYFHQAYNQIVKSLKPGWEDYIVW